MAFRRLLFLLYLRVIGRLTQCVAFQPGVAELSHQRARFEGYFKRLRAGVQFSPDLQDLFTGVLQGAGVVDHIIGGFDFFFVRKLCCHAALDFFAR